MTPTQTWQAVVEIIADGNPSWQVERGYDIQAKYDTLATSERPLVYVTLDSYTLNNVSTDAKIVQDEFSFGVNLLWRVCSGTIEELDRFANMSQSLLDNFRYKKISVNDTCLYFNLPECKRLCDDEIIKSDNICVITFNIPVTVYRAIE